MPSTSSFDVDDRNEGDGVRRRTRQRLTRGGLYGLLVLLVAVLAVTVDWASVGRNFFNLEVAASLFPEIVTIAAKNTVIYTVVAFVGGLAMGLVLALMKMSDIGPYRWLATAYIEFFRGLPALLTIFLFAFGLPIAFRFRANPINLALAALMFVAAAYMAETLRAGIEAVPKGQVEAARSLGMSQGRAMASIVIPQAFRIIIPPLTNEAVLLIKDTSLLVFAGSQPVQEELTKFARDGLNTNSNATPLIVGGLLYLAVTLPMTQLVAALERRNAQSR